MLQTFAALQLITVSAQCLFDAIPLWTDENNIIRNILNERLNSNWNLNTFNTKPLTFTKLYFKLSYC